MFALARSSGRTARVGFYFLALGWVLLSGLGGLVLAGLWGLTDHTAAYYNENLLQLNLLALPLVWLIPRAAGERIGRARAASTLALLVAAMSLLGLVLKVLPAFYQMNGQVIALALPAQLGLAAGLVRRARV
jgi:hypothetical protein